MTNDEMDPDGERINPTSDADLDEMMEGFLDPVSPTAGSPAAGESSASDDLLVRRHREAVRNIPRQPIDEAKSLVIDEPVEPAKTNMAGFESMLELAKIGKTKGAMARLDAYLDKIPKENRELALAMMVDFGWSPSDPEIINLMVWAHIVAAGKTIGVAIDASVADAVERLAGVVASAHDIHEAMKAALEEARGLNAEFLVQSQSQTDAIAQRVADAMRESAVSLSAEVIKLVDAAKASALAEIAVKKAEAEADVAGVAAIAIKSFESAPVHISAEIMALIKSANMLSSARNDARPSDPMRWKLAAAVGLLNGATVATALWVIFH